MVAGDDRPMKTCPDCAEQVLVDARKCRFCGYRFDGAEPERSDEGLMSLIVRPKPRPTTISAVVSRWGFELGDGEEAVELLICKVDGIDGFALVTDARLALLTGSRRNVALMTDLALNDIASVESIGRLFAHRLRVSWDGGAVTIHNLHRSKFDRLRSLLDP